MTDPYSGKLGFSGRIARFFLRSQITPLLALATALLGVFALIITPREEEPQINVTMANVMVAYPGASAKQVEQMVTIPAEQIMGQIKNIEHVMSVSQPGLAIITVQFEIGVSRTDALVSLHDTIQSNRDWLPKNAGIGEPIVKSKSIDDVPILSLTLFSQNPEMSTFDLERIAHSIEAELKSITGTREVKTHGGPGHAVNVWMDARRMQAANITVEDLRRALISANAGAPLGNLVRDNRALSIETGSFLHGAEDVGDIVVGVHERRPVFVRDVATVEDGAPTPTNYVWHGVAGPDRTPEQLREYPAVTISVTKKPGANAVTIADAVIARTQNLHGALVPNDIELSISRNNGAIAAERAQTLIHKLLFATVSVVALVFITLGRREAAVVGVAVGLTLLGTLFASWAYGFTLNRVSLFALIFSIGILVDDAIVVIENIHRRRALEPDAPLSDVIPRAVDEVGGPTILATLTVIAALLPMLFVTGLMGPYMEPIPVNASMGMLISLAIAFIVTPWLAQHWLPAHLRGGDGAIGAGLWRRISEWIAASFQPFLARVPAEEHNAVRNRRLLTAAIAMAIGISLLLPISTIVFLKVLPVDNKSEFQIQVDMPSGAALEQTAAVMREIGAYLATVPEVTSYQAYAGTSAPIDFNGLVRQSYLRGGNESGDIQVNLVGNHQRDRESHAIVAQIRGGLAPIARKHDTTIKVVEVPAGPPTLAPLVAEIYAPDDSSRMALAKAVRDVFENAEYLVDIDDTTVVPTSKEFFEIDRSKAALLGIAQDRIVATLRAGLSGENVTWLHETSKYGVPARLSLPIEDTGTFDALLALTVRAADGQAVPIRELVTRRTTGIDQPILHKDMQPVVFVTADVTGRITSPLYAMARLRSDLLQVKTPDGGTLREYFIRQPVDPLREYALRWDGEFKVTYETFRDMAIAYSLGLILIYLLIVAHFGSYSMPLIIMAPIPLTIIGVMPGHALFGSDFTSASMVGLIALAGIITRNSILLVDFIREASKAGMPFREAVIESAVTRAQPIALTGAAAMLGSLFILDDPVFGGLAISLIFGVFVSALLTLVLIPLLYYVTYRRQYEGESHRD